MESVLEPRPQVTFSSLSCLQPIVALMAWTDPRTGATSSDPHGPDWQYPASGPALPSPPPSPPPPPPNKWAPWLVFGVALIVAGAIGFAVTAAATDDDNPQSFNPPVLEPSPTSSNPISPGPSSQVPTIGPPPTVPPATSPPVTTAPDPDAAALRRLVVQPGDVPSDYQVDLIPGGDETGEQVTLDLCDGAFPSETRRAARRQVAAVDDRATRWFSTEAVLYENPAAARQALRELEQARSDCPTTPQLLPSGDLAVTTFAAPPDRAWPEVAGVTRQAYDYTRSDVLFNEQRSVAVYLVRGRALLALYFVDVDTALIPVRRETTLADITNLFERRLAALPESVVAAP